MSTTQIPAFGKTKHLSRIFIALTKQFFVSGKTYKLDNAHSFKALEVINNTSQEVTISFWRERKSLVFRVVYGKRYSNYFWNDSTR